MLFFGSLLKPFQKLENSVRSNKKVFTDIYKKNRWYSNEVKDGEFNSGSGSDSEFATPYAKLIREYVNSNRLKTIIDLGCGDYRVGGRIMKQLGPAVNYVGIDVVDELIIHHLKHFSASNVDFCCLDLTQDDFPRSEKSVYLVRQVLQHLSNREILRVIQRLPEHAHVIVTEHQPKSNIGVKPNQDKVHGADTRVSKKSAVYLDEPPFSFKLELLLEVDLNKDECLRTFRLLRH